MAVLWWMTLQRLCIGSTVTLFEQVIPVDGRILDGVSQLGARHAERVFVVGVGGFGPWFCR